MPGADLRIALDYRPALLTGAGIGRAVRELSRALAATDGVDLHLFGHSLARARRSDPMPAGARLHRMPIPGRSLPLLERLGLDAGRLAGQPAVFHWTDYVHPPVASARRVLTVHDLAFTADPAFHGPQTDFLLSRCRAALAGAARVVCPTEATATALREDLGFDAARIAVVPFGADHVPSRPGPAPLDEPYVLALGTIEPRKNHRLLLAAWRALPEPRTRLVVLGRRGWECDDIVEQLESAADSGSVTWLEDATDAEVWAWLAHATVLAYPSKLEGFGFPPLEALALGTPVIAGDTPALREVLGDAAWFCDTGEPEQLANLLAELLGDAAARAALAASGRARAARFRWARCAAAHLDVYRSALR